jgi:hypothetical protein
MALAVDLPRSLPRMGSSAFRQIVFRRSLTAMLALVFLALPVAASGGSGKLRMLKGW